MAQQYCKTSGQNSQMQANVSKADKNRNTVKRSKSIRYVCEIRSNEINKQDNNNNNENNNFNSNELNVLWRILKEKKEEKWTIFSFCSTSSWYYFCLINNE